MICEGFGKKGFRKRSEEIEDGVVRSMKVVDDGEDFEKRGGEAHYILSPERRGAQPQVPQAIVAPPYASLGPTVY